MVWGLIAPVAAYAAGKKKGRKGSTSEGTVNKQYPGGTAAYYDDSYKVLLDYLQKSGASAAAAPGAYENILREFKGRPRDLREFLDAAGPFLASSLGGAPSFTAIQDFAKRDFGQEWGGYANLMPAYGAGAGQLAQGATEATRLGTEQLSRAGLGRSSARAGLASRAASAASTGQSNLFGQLFQAQQQAKLGTAQAAAGMQQGALAEAFDTERAIAQLALGQNPGPRLGFHGSGGGQSPWGSVAALGGGLLGTALGGGFGGAAGAAAGQAAQHIPGVG